MSNSTILVRIVKRQNSFYGEEQLAVDLVNTAGLSPVLVNVRDGMWGWRSPGMDGTWTGMIKDLLDDYADMTVAVLDPTPDRVNAVDFISLPFFWFVKGFIFNSQLLHEKRQYKWWRGLSALLWGILALHMGFTYTFSIKLIQMPSFSKIVITYLAAMGFVFNVAFSTFLMDYLVIWSASPLNTLNDTARLIDTESYELVAPVTFLSGHSWKGIVSKNVAMAEVLQQHPILLYSSYEKAYIHVNKNPKRFSYGTLRRAATILRKSYMKNVVLSPDSGGRAFFCLSMLRKGSFFKNRLEMAAHRLYESGIHQENRNAINEFLVPPPPGKSRPILFSDIMSILSLHLLGDFISMACFWIEMPKSIRASQWHMSE